MSFAKDYPFFSLPCKNLADIPNAYQLVFVKCSKSRTFGTYSKVRRIRPKYVVFYILFAFTDRLLLAYYGVAIQNHCHYIFALLVHYVSLNFSIKSFFLMSYVTFLDNASFHLIPKFTRMILAPK